MYLKFLDPSVILHKLNTNLPKYLLNRILILRYIYIFPLLALVAQRKNILNQGEELVFCFVFYRDIYHTLHLNYSSTEYFLIDYLKVSALQL